tara:strand:- start:1484 stop:1657 length:174 start_codon:yes stop_codon:yes gene_type:complete
MFRSCTNCGNDRKQVMTVTTPVGTRYFCSDRCYAEYLGINIDDIRGYYESHVVEDEE